MSGVVTTKATGYAAGQPTEGSLFMRRKGQPDGVGPGVVCSHGHGADCLQYLPNTARSFAPGYFAYLLAREGFRVLAIDNAGQTTWGDQASTDRINDAITWLQTSGGAKAGKVGMMGWSMGGIATLNWLDQNIAKHACSWLWAPATDMAYFAADGTYGPEITTAYPGGYANDNPATVPAHYRAVGPVHIVHATDDATVPIAQSRSFVAAVNDPQVRLAEYPTGGHTALFGNPTDLEFVRFFTDALPIS